MSEVSAMLDGYATIRRKFRNPPNAVADHGIDLKRKKQVETKPPKPVTEPAPEVGKFDYLLSPLWFCGPILSMEVRYRRPVRNVYIAEIQDAVAKHYGLNRHDLLAFRRTSPTILPRQIAMYLCRTLTTNSLPAIGEKFSGRDHTTVLHSCRKIEALRGTDPELNGEIEKLIAVLKPAA